MEKEQEAKQRKKMRGKDEIGDGGEDEDETNCEGDRGKAGEREDDTEEADEIKAGASIAVDLPCVGSRPSGSRSADGSRSPRRSEALLVS